MYAIDPKILSNSEAPVQDFARVGIMNDYVRIPYANGSSFASQMIYRELTRRGHEVTVIGPEDPAAQPHQLPKRHLLLKALPLRNHPGVYLPFPSPAALRRVEEQNFDVMLGQVGSELMDLGVWLRAKRGVPLLCVNTIHLPSVYNVVLPDALHDNRWVLKAIERSIIPRLEAHSAKIYNGSDGLIVLSSGLKSYWRERGVTCPIHVIPRAVEPRIFDNVSSKDPFPAHFKRGHRLLVVCRHTREKSVDRLLELFAKLIAPAAPDATLTLIGDGPDHADYKKLARALGVEARTHFTGELPVTQVPTWYAHGDVFVYTSLSETFGQVIGEALWCGITPVAFADDKGVSEQIVDGVNGYLVAPGPNAAEANWRFANAVLGLLRSPQRRARIAEEGARRVREQRHPDGIMLRYYEAFAEARRNAIATRAGQAPSAFYRARMLARWTSLHSLLALGGCLRSPAKMDLEGREQPVWDSPFDDDESPRRPSMVVPSADSESEAL